MPVNVPVPPDPRTTWNRRNPSGDRSLVVNCACVPFVVVDVNVSETPPIVTTVLTAVSVDPLDVCRARTCPPLLTLPGDDENAPPLMLAVPPVTVTATGVSMPVIVTAELVTTDDVPTPVRSVNV